jgi:hypothetical protein
MKIEYESLHRAYKNCITEDGFRDMVAKSAYFKSEKKGFTAGCELQNWLEAEEEVSKQCFYWFQEVE